MVPPVSDGSSSVACSWRLACSPFRHGKESTMTRQSVARSVHAEHVGADSSAGTRSELGSLVWHTQPVDSVVEAFGTSPDGLTTDEAALRLDSYGLNELQTLQRSSAWHTLAAQFKNVLIVILLAATLLSGLLGHSL